MIERCRQCGTCCELIAQPVSPEELEKWNALECNRFQREHFEPVEKPAEKPNLLMSNEEFELMYYYRCNLHDAKTGKCTIYDDRPAMCRNYPQGVRPEQLSTDKCGYTRKSEAK